MPVHRYTALHSLDEGNMKKILYYLSVCLLISSVLSGCKKSSANIAEPESIKDSVIEIVSEDKTEDITKDASEDKTENASEKITEDQALASIQNYCLSINPDLENIMNEGQYPVYFEVVSANEEEIVILFRSYTGAQNRYYIDRITGDTYVTEFVPGITDDEVRTDEQFNLKDY